MSINKSKKLFFKLEELYKKEYKETNIFIYEQIVNITFVEMGARIACSLYFNNGEEFVGIYEKIKDYDENLKIVVQTQKFSDSVWYEYIFINLQMIKINGLTDEYNSILSGKSDHIARGKLFGYICPSNIFEKVDEYIKKDKELRRRFIYEYYIYTKSENNEIQLDDRAQLFVFICYDDKLKKYQYNIAIKNLKKYQRALEKITQKLHIGFSYQEEII